MKNGNLILKESNEGDQNRHITAFTALKREYGLQIQVAGCVNLHPAQNGSDDVIGVIEMDDQTVPVLDARINQAGTISDLCCIVLFENVVGDTTIITARLFEDACQVFDLIVKCMDHPSESRRIYGLDSPSVDTVNKTVKQKS